MTGSTCRLVCGAALLCLLGATASVAEDDPAAVLREAGVAPTLAGVEAYLRGLVVDDRLKARVATLVGQLGSEDFDTREKATEELGRIGPAAIEPLQAASRSSDAEVRMRATDLLARLDSAEGRRRREALPLAACAWLARTKPAGATALLLDLLPSLNNPAHREAAAAALWACVGPGDAQRLRRLVQAGPAEVRAAVLPALEVAEGAEAVDLIRGYLKDAHEPTRLAAARALLDRQPAEAVAALLGLLDSEDADARTQAARLLQLASGIPGEKDRDLDWKAAVARWRSWAADTGERRPVGAARLQPERYGLILAVTFDAAAASLQEGYGRLLYETNCAGKGSVAGGTLRLDGKHPGEGDQRLYASAEKLLGRPTFPKAFQVRARLGGEAELSGAWHVGVSVGNVRVLFHPAFDGGAFRVERVDNNRFLHENADMTFTPAAGVLHDLTLDVRTNEDGTTTLDVRIADGGESGKEFRRTVRVKAEDIGPLSRVGLERSGRTGGAALFGSLTIRR